MQMGADGEAKVKPPPAKAASHICSGLSASRTIFNLTPE